MSLTFTELSRSSMGKKAVKMFQVTHDGSTTDMSASSFGLHFIDVAITTAAGGGADTNTAELSVSTQTTVISFAGAMSSGAKQNIQVIGW